MSRVYKDEDYKNAEDGRYVLRIRPEGWTQDLLIEYGAFHQCGQAEAGIGIRLGDGTGGGVLTLDDMLAISKVINSHFKKLYNTPLYEDFLEEDESSD